MNLSASIAEMIFDMLEQENEIEIQRNILAQEIGCVPSQINYVLSSRFTPERGFIVESRRGGGGCIRISRISNNKDTLLMHVINSVGDSIDERTCRNHIHNLLYSELVSEEQAALIHSATAENSLRCLPVEMRDIVRASIFKQMLLCILK